MPERAPKQEAAPLPPIETKEYEGPFWRAVSAQAASEKHPGENQDVILVNEALGLVTLCDGMGGHEGGREAAATVAVAIQEHFEALDWDIDDHEALDLLPESMIKAIRSAQVKLLEQRGDSNRDTTVTSLLLHRHSSGAVLVIIGHVGNSRAYEVRDGGEVRRLTEDDDLMATVDGAKLVLGLKDDEEVGPAELDRRRRAVRREMEQAQSVRELSAPALMLYNYRNVVMGVGSEQMTVAVDVYRFPPGGKIALMSDGVNENLGRRTGGLLSMATVIPAPQLAEEMLGEAQNNAHTRPATIPTAHPDDMSIIILEAI